MLTSHCPNLPFHCNHRTFPIRQGFTACTQRGATALAFIPAAMLIGLLGFGGLESIWWLHTRQVVSLALLEAARAGSTQHASPQAMADAFERALLPLHATARSGAPARLASTLAHVRTQTGASPWRIEVLRPSPADFLRHGIKTLTIPEAHAKRAIDNNYQHEQQLQLASDSTDENSIFRANVLSLRLIYLHRPLTPGIAPLLSAIAGTSDNYVDNAMAHGYLPMLRLMHIGMESHAVQWPSLTDGRVITDAGSMAPLLPPHTIDIDCGQEQCLSPFTPEDTTSGDNETIPDETDASSPGSVEDNVSPAPQPSPPTSGKTPEFLMPPVSDAPADAMTPPTTDAAPAIPEDGYPMCA